MADIKVLQDMAEGNLPPIKVKLEERNIIMISAAVVLVTLLVVMIKRRF